jgi:ankyrin repeat protein
MDQERADILINACFESLEKASELLDEDHSLLFEITGLGETPLHYLAVENQIDAVKLLYSKGAELNTINECAGTPLSEAASLGHIDIVKFLLENGASINQVPDGDPIIHEAVRSGNSEIVDLLVRYGADIDATDSIGQTPLHESVSEDERLEVSKYLVEMGVNIDAMDGFNTTPLTTAALHGCFETVKFLVSSGASLTIRDDKGRTATEMAESQNYHEIAAWLIEAEEKTKKP